MKHLFLGAAALAATVALVPVAFAHPGGGGGGMGHGGFAALAAAWATWAEGSAMAGSVALAIAA